MTSKYLPMIGRQFVPVFAIMWCSILCSLEGTSQVFLPESSTQSPGVADYQRSFQKWSEGKNLDSTRGWKWYKRWEEDYAKRTTLGQTFPKPGTFLFEAVRFSALKKQSSASKKSAWTAVGPDVFPSPGNSYVGMGRINCIAFHPTDSNTFWVGVAQGGVWKTIDGGTAWTPLTDDLPVIRISDIAVNKADPDIMYICVGDYAYLGVSLQLDARKRNTHFGLGVYKTLDGGISWQPTGLTFSQTDGDASLMRRVFMHRNNPDTLVAAGINGIWKSLDAGSTWTQILDTIIWDIEYDPLNPEVLYASTGYIASYDTGSAGIMKSVDFGSTWNALNSGVPPTQQAQRVELAIAPSDPNYIYAIACDMIGGLQGVYRSIDAGATWSMQTGSFPNVLEWYDGSGSDGQGTYDLSLMVSPFDKNIIYTGGINMWTSPDGGLTWNGCSSWWTQSGTSLHADQHQFAYNPLDGKYYVCNDAGISRTDTILPGSWSDFWNVSNYEWPTNWEFVSNNMQISSFYRLGLCKSYPEYLLAGAQDNSTFFKSQSTWRHVSGGDGMECIMHPSDTNILYVSSQYGRLSLSSDGGNSFNIISYFGEQGEWTTPYTLDPSDMNMVYAGYGNVVKRNYFGGGWSAISNFPIVPGYGYPNLSSALAIAPGNSDVICVAKRIYHQYNEPSRLYYTMNGGGLWTDVTAGLPDSLYPTYLAIDDKDEQVVWVTYSGFVDSVKVFKTADGGNSWQNMSLNLPNVPVNSVIIQPNTMENIVYVGTDLGVYYISDTATSWQLYSTDLPNVIVSELEIDTANNELYAATFGRGIWKTSIVPGTPCPFIAAPSGIAGITSPCVGDTGLVYTADTVDGAVSYSWTHPSAWIVTSSDTGNAITLTASGNPGLLCITANNSCTSSAPVCLTLIPLFPPSMPTNIAGPDVVCQDDTSTYSTTSNGATSYTWTVPAGASIISGQGTSSISVSWGATQGDICVSAANNCGTNAPGCLTIGTCVTLPDGTQKIQSKMELSPSPVQDHLTVHLTCEVQSSITLRIKNNLGQTVYSEIVSAKSQSNKYLLDFTQFSSGIYFVEADFGRETLIEKIVK